MITRRIAATAVVLGLMLVVRAGAADSGHELKHLLPLTRGDEAACRIVVLDGPAKANDVGTPLALDKAAEELQSVVQRWVGVKLAAEHRPAAQGMPKEPSI